MMPKKISSVLFIFLSLAVFYLFMKITNMRIDLSRAGLQNENTEKFDKCLKEYEAKFPPPSGKISFASHDYCINNIPEKERIKKVFRWPKIYFSKPK